MSQSQHLIASCEWQTQYADVQNVKALQDALSQWSHQVMPTLVDELLNQYCPPNQVWHIGRLELDLGKLMLEDMDETLPRRLSQALASAFERLLSQQGSRALDKDNLSVEETEQGIARTVEWWLLHGSLPWWHRDQQNILALVDDLLREQRTLVPGLLRRTGQYENVRRRIVWQWQEERVKQSILLLEPWHGDFICQYAGQLIANQTRVTALPSDRGFQSHVWYWVLTHMLVERGSMFNTQAFIHSTMLQMAQHYQVDYDALLDQFTSVFTHLSDAGISKAPYWLSALQMLAKQEEAPIPVAHHSEQSDSLWHALQSMLHQQARYQVIQHQQVGLAELFTDLVRLDRGRVAGILRTEGRSEKVREHIIRTFTQVELECLIEVVEPYDHHFITSHATYTQRLLEQEQMDTTIIWRVLLTYLLVEKGSQFNRRQFVKATLERISQIHKLDYDHLLLTLTQVIVHHKLNAGQFELLAILQTLRQERSKDRAQANRHMWSVLRHYLLGTHDTASRSVLSGITDTEHSRTLNAIRASLLGQQVNAAQILHELLQQSNLANLDQDVLSERLLSVIRRSGAMGWLELRSVLKLLAPNITPAGVALLQEIYQWYQQGKLFALASVLDFNTLAKVSIKTALGFPQQSFSVEQWSIAVIQNLAQALSMTRSRLEQQLYQAALLEQPETASGRLVKALITDQTSVYKADVSIQLKGYSEHQIGTLLLSVWEQEQGILPVLYPWLSESDLRSIIRRVAQQPLAEWLALVKADQSVTKPTASIVVRLKQAMVNFLRAQQRRLQEALLAQILQRSDAASAIMSISQSSEGEAWLAPWLPETFKTHQQQQLLWASLHQALERILGSKRQTQLSVASWPAQWQAEVCQTLVRIWHRMIKQHGKIAVSRIDMADMVLRILQRWYTHQALASNDIAAALDHLVTGSQAQANHQLWQSVLRQWRAVSDASQMESTEPQTQQFWWQDEQRVYLKRPDIAHVLEQWLRYGITPQSQTDQAMYSLGQRRNGFQFNGSQLVHDLLLDCPEQFFHWLKPIYHKDFVADRLLRSLQLEDVLSALERVSPPHGFVRHAVLTVRALLLSLGLPLQEREITPLILRYVLEGWMNELWLALAPAPLLEAVLLAFYHAGVVELDGLISALTAPNLHIAPTLRAGVANLIAQLQRIKNEAEDRPINVTNSDKANANDQVSMTQTRHSADQIQPVSRTDVKDSPTAYPLVINNAGLVLCQGYISALFNRLQLIEGEQFIDQEAQRSAVLYLQYLATGQTSASEQYLLLNKILCGVPLNAPVEQDMPISQADAEVIESLIEAVVNYWPAIGSSSIDGFRGNWLVRDGTLTETEDHWDLIVEKRPYDILLDRFPMSYSIIKLPWMNKPIYVTWPT